MLKGSGLTWVKFGKSVEASSREAFISSSLKWNSSRTRLTRLCMGWFTEVIDLKCLEGGQAYSKCLITTMNTTELRVCARY